MTHVVLSPPEITLAAIAGVMRQVANIRDKRKHRHGFTGGPWQIHIEGALAEKALAKHLGLYWPGMGKLREPDVGVVDVRQTEYSSGDLRLHKDDPDERRFWLLTGENGTYDVRGWLLARDGKLEKYWGEKPRNPGRPAFWVPQSDLVKP